MSAFYEGMAEILELEPAEITPDLRLEDVNWDSLAIVSTIALIDDVCGVAVSASKLTECETIADVEKVIADEQANGG